MDMLNVRHTEGRAVIAQQLQSVGEQCPHEERRTSNGRLVAIDNDENIDFETSAKVREVRKRPNTRSAIESSHPATTPTTAKLSGSSALSRSATMTGSTSQELPSKPSMSNLDRLHFRNCKMRADVEMNGEKAASKDARAEERHVDSWGKQGQDGRWTRVHRSARRALFTPFKVAGGPGKRSSLKRLRVTRGRFFSTGREFKIIDDWTVPSHAHRLLESAWIGTTDFREVVEYLSDSSDNESDGQAVKEDVTKLNNPIAHKNEVMHNDQKMSETIWIDMTIDDTRVKETRCVDSLCVAPESRERLSNPEWICQPWGSVEIRPGIHTLRRPAGGRQGETRWGARARLGQQTDAHRASDQVKGAKDCATHL